jgi:hypothetical protein
MPLGTLHPIPAFKRTKEPNSDEHSDAVGQQISHKFYADGLLTAARRSFGSGTLKYVNVVFSARLSFG